MSEPFTREERDAVLARIRDVEAVLYPAEGQSSANRNERDRLRERLLVLQGEYADRLPRVTMSVCPFTGDPLKRTLDPWGFDGPWWHKDRTFTPQEPAPPATFKTLLGALDLRGRTPSDAELMVIPGPDAPFVVPRLLELPGMAAVISRLELATGDVAYPIAYFSPEEIEPDDLHQFWTRPELWLNTVGGDDGWIMANDPFDFDLAKWIETGQLWWCESLEPGAKPLGRESGRACPFVGLPGDHQPQVLSGGARELDDLPDGNPVEPFEP